MDVDNFLTPYRNDTIRGLPSAKREIYSVPSVQATVRALCIADPMRSEIARTLANMIGELDEKFQPGRRCIKQIPQFNHGAMGQGGRAHRGHPPACNGQGRRVVALGPRGQHQPPDGPKAGQSLAAKTERPDVQQV